MPRHKTHFEVVISPPNESDNEGDSVIACALEYVEKCTTFSDLVTCKNCLRNIAKRAARLEAERSARRESQYVPF